MSLYFIKPEHTVNMTLKPYILWKEWLTDATKNYVIFIWGKEQSIVDEEVSVKFVGIVINCSKLKYGHKSRILL